MIFPMAFPMEVTDAVREAAEAPSRRPGVRVSDPSTSHLAAESMSDGVTALEAAILAAAPDAVALTAFDLAAEVEAAHPGRWDEGSIRTRVSALGKAGRLVKDTWPQTSPRGRVCDAWLLP